MNTPIVRSVLTASVKKLHEHGRTITFVGTKESMDRTGDIIRVAGWEFANFKKNPVFLFNHDARIPPIGKVVKIEVVDKEVLFDVEFATFEINPFADTIFKLFVNGFMSAVSVGFIPKDMEGIFSDDGMFMGLEILRQELLELSAVAIPAHQDALAASVYAKEFDQNLQKVRKQGEDGAGSAAVSLEEYHKMKELVMKPKLEDEVELQKQIDELKTDIVDLTKANVSLQSQVEGLLTLKEAVELSKATMATLNKSIVGLVNTGASTGRKDESDLEGSTPTPGSFDIKPLLKAMETVANRVKEQSFKPKGDKT